MKSFIVYSPTGKILRYGNCQDELIEHQANDQESVIEAEFRNDCYVENGQLIDKPKQPDVNHVFDYITKTYQPDYEGAATRAIKNRNDLLASGPDRVNPMWWSSMTDLEQKEVSEYRQALLDITNQSGYPLEIEWPPVPSVFNQ